MLPKEKRIKTRAFREIFSHGQVFHSPLFTLRVFFDEKNISPARFSFVVSRKVGRTAPLRNLLRRRGYAAVQKFLHGARQGFSCVFFFKKDAVRVPYADIEKTVGALLKRARVIS
ncbi:MAG: ribonuclease P protein component [Patescibacteria group bacterium]|mgnify:FL=1